MKKWFKRVSPWLLISAILTTYTVPVCAAAEIQIEIQNIPEEAIEFATEVIINPLYKDIPDEEVIAGELEEWAGHNAGIATYSAGKVCGTVEEAQNYLRAEMLNRAESVTVVVPCEYDLNNYESVFSALSYEIFDGAMKYSDSCSGQEGDALAYGWSGARFNISAEGNNVSITFMLSYYTTKAQEDELTAAVNKALKEMQLNGLSEYDKVKKIHDYICDHVNYDYANMENPNYILKHSAYAALIHGKAVCQGYTVLFYRMCKDAGLSVRCVSGTAVREAHSWNIVRIGNVYYNVDCTWDGQDSALLHTWFLKSPQDFPNHTRDADYNTAEFHREFPMSSQSWKDSTAATPVSKITLDRTELKLMNGTSYELKSTVSPDNATNKSLAWKSSDTRVATVDSNGKVTAVSVGTATITVTAQDGSGASASCKVVVILQPAPPAFTVNGVFGGRDVIFTSDTKGAVIYYSTESSDMTTADAKKIENGAKVTFKNYYGTLYAKAYYNGQWSNVSRLILRIPTVNTPDITQDGSKVTIRCSTPESYVYYTLDGSTPSMTNGTKIAPNKYATFSLTSGTVKAIAVRNCFTSSEVAEKKINSSVSSSVKVPSFKVVGVFGGREVTFTSEPGAEIYYSTSSTMTSNDPHVKSGGKATFENFYGTIYARSYKDGKWSNPARLILKIPVVNTPTITASSGGYVTIKTTTPDSKIIFTTDGSTPSLTNGKTIHASSSKIYVGTGKTVKAIAVRSCFTNSKMATYKN